MKIGIIRCDEHSRDCAGWNCFPAMQNKTGEFQSYETVELVGFDTCGGCSRGTAKNITAKALRLREKGAEVIHLGNCLAGGCPFRVKYARALRGEGLTIVEKTHPGPTPEQIKAFRKAMTKARREEKKANATA